MQSENETVEAALKVLRAYPKTEASDGSGLVVLNNMAIADRIEAAHRREVVELERKVREYHLAFLAERARHTDTYKDERIRAQDAELKTAYDRAVSADARHAVENERLKREVAELRECLKDAVESYCEGCNDFVEGKQKCEPCECKARKWRDVLAKASGKSEVKK